MGGRLRFLAAFSLPETIEAPAVDLTVKAPFTGQLTGALEALFFLEVPVEEPVSRYLPAQAGDQIPGLIGSHGQSCGERLTPRVQHEAVTPFHPHGEADRTAFTALRLILQRGYRLMPFLRAIGPFRKREPELPGHFVSAGQTAPVFGFRIDIRIKEESKNLMSFSLEPFRRPGSAHCAADM